MKWVFAFILALFVQAATAQTARVTSGEHDGFTRVVVDFGRVVDWQVGRDMDGYRLRIQGEAANFDLSRAFALIGKSRLAALDVDAQAGDLEIGMACACHAIPFEFRPGIVVIDLKDGPPPKDSFFETTLPGVASVQAQPAVSDLAPTTAVTYDWKQMALDRVQPPAVAPTTGPDSRFALSPPNPSLQPLRDNLMEQLAIGASKGVVEFSENLPEQTGRDASFPSAQIRVGSDRSAVNQPSGEKQDSLGATGAVCIDGGLLDIAAWGDETVPPMSQLGDLRAKLTAEFDAADPNVLAQSVRLLLYLGFGAEARQEIAAFDAVIEDAPVLTALGRLMDGEADRQRIFTGQAACGGPAALWAFLADTELQKGDPINEGAIRMAFSALPLHLRKLLGPRLADRFLELGQTEAARALNDAIARAPEGRNTTLTLMEADLNLDLGEPREAEKRAKSVLSDPGQDHHRALVALTLSRVAQELPIEEDTVLALAAFVDENRGSPDERALREALMLAQAASGDFDTALQAVKDFPERTETIWILLAKLAPDEVFLAHSVLPAEAAYPKLGLSTVTIIAERLLHAGLGKAAAAWLGNTAEANPDLRAQVALQNRDGRAALVALSTVDDENATTTRLEALDLLGAYGAQAELLKSKGDAEAEALARVKAQDWQGLASLQTGLWTTLAQEVIAPIEPSSPQPGNDLARSQALVESAAQTRANVQALLAEAGLQVADGP